MQGLKDEYEVGVIMLVNRWHLRKKDSRKHVLVNPSYLLRCSSNQVKLLDIGVATSYFDFLEAGVQEGTHNKK